MLDPENKKADKKDEELDKLENLICLLKDDKVIADIDFISKNYKCIATKITELESLFSPADEAVNLVEEVGATLKSNAATPESVIKKYENVFTKNSGYVILRDYFKEGIHYYVLHTSKTKVKKLYSKYICPFGAL